MTSGRITSSFHSAIAAAAVTCVLGLVLCASFGLAQTGRPLEKITFLLDFVPYGKHAPFYVAMDKGFWRDAGFDGKIVGGEGSATTISSYAAGTVDFAFADSPNLIIARSRGVKVKVAGIIHDKSLYAIGTLVENNINSPQDLKGKRIGAPVGDAGRNLFSGFAKLNGLDPASVQWVDMTAPARAASLVLGQVDAVSIFLTETPTFAAKAKEVGKTWKDLPYADFGFDLYSSGLLVREELIAKDPDRVRRFVESTLKAWAWSIENPQEAVAIFSKYNPAVDPNQAREHFRIAVRHLMTDTAKREGIGYIDPAKMKRTVDTVSQYFNISGVAPDDVYTNAFTPKLFPKEAAF
jgi:NitT/TauT family transport system substrate-binding protein